MAAVAGRRPQGCFGTQRNTIDGFNVYVFAEEDYLRPDPYIPRYLDSHVIRKEEIKTIRNGEDCPRQSDKTHVR
jgi:hypothetical protein